TGPRGMIRPSPTITPGDSTGSARMTSPFRASSDRELVDAGAVRIHSRPTAPVAMPFPLGGSYDLTTGPALAPHLCPHASPPRRRPPRQRRGGRRRGTVRSCGHGLSRDDFAELV